MKSASKVLYTIGKFFNVIEIVGELLVIIFAIIGMVNAPMMVEMMSGMENSMFATEAALKTTALGGLIGGIVALIISVVVMILAFRATKALDNGAVENGPHITMIVIGVIGGNIFYLLGGIFGLIAENTLSSAGA
ncbi:MAG: hypothetical protein J6N93_06820 [Clostridia bacterium]|nr:hypothetical protein [Clostridia bacterium]